MLNPNVEKKELHKTPEALRIIIAGGGTGGHLFPGIAIAQEFTARNPNSNVLFVGAGKPFETSILSELGFKHAKITAAGIKGRGTAQQALSIAKIPKGIFESIMILKRFKPDLVIGVGGYAAGPLVTGAWLLGIRIALHEQNILMGITNRILSRLADRIFISFENTPLELNGRKVHVTGNPVRKEILQRNGNQKVSTVAGFGKQRPFTVLIIGGSQGARGINLAVMEAVEHIREKDAFFFIHQTGVQDETLVKAAYQRCDIAGKVQAFFVDMARQYQQADLVICRAGATTVAEITAIGKGVVFIPFPFAADNHQVLNARTLTNAAAAEMILEKDLSGRVLADKIEYFASNPEALSQMASKAKDFGRPDAAAMIVNNCYNLMNS
jgi:UDP-N-acetylglucosamine--N-acetylmuramyl-(pentapeptide) pyrophosphoryl-undecaprenol N-acetylglucosamine transferase